MKQDVLNADTTKAQSSPEKERIASSSLHEAATLRSVVTIEDLVSQKAGTPEQPRTFLTLGSDVNYRDRRRWTSPAWNGETRLHWAVMRGHVDAVKALLQANASVDAADYSGETPLHIAADWGFIEIVKALINARANTNAIDWQGRTPLHMAEESIRTRWVRIGHHIHIIKALLDANAHIEAADEKGMTPLHAAADRNHAEAVQALLDARANKEARDKSGRTPLHIAAKGGHLEAVKVLLDAQVNKEARDKNERTPLHRAAKRFHLDVVKALLDARVNKEARDKNERTPLHLAAACSRHIWICAEGSAGLPVRVKGIAKKKAWTIKVLLNANVNKDARDKEGMTPLHVAAAKGYVESIRALLDAQADKEARDKYGMTPLQRAAEGGHVDAVYTLKFGTKARKRFIVSAPFETMLLDHLLSRIQMIEDPGKHLFPSVQKITNNLYAARIPQKNLILVMERIDDRTLPLWRSYSNVQSHPRVAEAASEKGKRGIIKASVSSGSGNFRSVLTKVSHEENEIWVAYITKASYPQPIRDSIKNYDATNVWHQPHPFAKDIEMYVTVTSSPRALITSHMGIASTFEGKGNRAKGTSVDLHSFAAKVMLMRNPQRRYMVNTPVFAMEKILVDALPHSVFVGTREMLQKMQAIQKVTFEEFRAKTEQLCLEQLQKEAQTEKAKNSESGTENPSMTAEQKEAKLLERLKEKFEEFREPYGLPEGLSIDAFLKFIEEHPPLLSVAKNHPTWPRVPYFTIFEENNASKPWLSIEPKTQDYKWMYDEPFEPGGCHYIVVKLLDLALSRAIE